jgi:glycosyltransferase involved in cell wall biosynthesis
MKEEITAVIPCFNEENTIYEISIEISKYCKNIVIINDGSTDSTHSELLKLKNELGEFVNIVNNDKNRGIGYSVKKGLEIAINSENKYILKIDSDWQHNPEDIPRFVKKAKNEGLDYVKGNRFLLKESIGNMPMHKLIGNFIITNLQKIISGNYKISDPNNGFLLFRRDIFKVVLLDNLKDNYFFENSLLINVVAHSFKIGEIGIETVYGDEKSSIPVVRASFKIIPTFINFLFLKNTIRAKYNLSFNSLIFFIFLPTSFMVFIFEYNYKYQLIIGLFSIYLLIDLLNYFSGNE